MQECLWLFPGRYSPHKVLAGCVPNKGASESSKITRQVITPMRDDEGTLALYRYAETGERT